MLRTFKIENHRLNRAQRFVNHLFLDIILNSQKLKLPNFDVNWISLKYLNLINEVDKKYLRTPIEDMFIYAKNIKPKDLKIIRKAVHNNSKIKQICEGSIEFVSYNDLNNIDKQFSKKINDFFRSLYNKVSKYKEFKEKFYDLKMHYDNLVGSNNICRICGIGRIVTNNNRIHRSDFDHYIPKSELPFSSICTYNLVPSCDDCNKKFKSTSNPVLEKSKTKRIALYPFCTNNYDVNLSIICKRIYTLNFKPKNIIVTVSSNACKNEFETFNKVFKISDRYANEVCDENWYSGYFEEYFYSMNSGCLHTDYINKLERNRFYDKNFLKIPFFESINRTGFKYVPHPNKIDL